MKRAAALGGCGVLLLVVTGVGCVAKSGATAKTADPAVAKAPGAETKGRWVILPPETGSHIPRRVWMNEDRTIAAAPGGPAVDSYSPSVMQEWQRRGSFHGRTGN